MDELKENWQSIRNATEEERQEYYRILANQQRNVNIVPTLEAYLILKHLR